MNKELPDGIISMMDKSYNQAIDHAIKIIDSQSTYLIDCDETGVFVIDKTNVLFQLEKLKKNTL